MSQASPVQKTKVVIALTQPRLTFTDHFLSVTNTVHRLGWPHVFYGGAFWDQSLTGCIHGILEMYDPEYIFFVDFDTVYEPEVAVRLVEALDGRPDLSAVFAVQMSRHDDRPLCFDPLKRYEAEELTEQICGHFGATVIRASVFKELSEPWFWGMPDDEGKWSQIGKTDPDIYFWKYLAVKGLKVAQLNTAVVGHMELCVKWPTGKGCCYQAVRHYGKTGKPAAVGHAWNLWREKYIESNQRRYEEHIARGGKPPEGLPLPEFKADEQKELAGV